MTLKLIWSWSLCHKIWIYYVSILKYYSHYVFAWDCRNILGLHYTNLLIKMGLPGLSTRVGSFAFCWVSAWIRPSDAIEFSKNSTNDMVIELNSRSFLKFVILFILKQCLRINASNPGKIMYKRLSLILISYNHIYFSIIVIM